MPHDGWHPPTLDAGRTATTLWAQQHPEDAWKFPLVPTPRRRPQVREVLLDTLVLVWAVGMSLGALYLLAG